MRYSQLGLTDHDPERASAGFTLFSPLLQKKTFILNMAGAVVHEWDLPDHPALYGYLLANGNLLIAIHTDEGPSEHPGKGGLIQELGWDGSVVWEYRDATQHHDFRRLDNGNTIYLAWEILPDAAASQIKGGRPGSEPEEGIWGDYIREVDPAGETVWEWHAHEHVDFSQYPLPANTPRVEYAHPNALHALKDGNLLICYRHIDTIAVIDRQTGAEIWHRQVADWGGQHDAQELDNGNFMLFANRSGKGPLRGSTVIEFDRDSAETVWEYNGTPSHTFDSHYISGCQRLWSGNTLICEGLWGRIFEVTPEGDIVWEYISPYFVPDEPKQLRSGTNTVFRAYRYAPDSPEIGGRL